jgi:hypothetical protein
MDIGMLGWWHYDNQGDRRILQNMTRALAPHRVVPIDLPFSINEDWIRRFNLLDFLILGGGGLFQETPPPPFVSFDEWGSELQCPIGVVGIGIDQVLPRHQGVISALVEQSRFFFVRDAESRRLVEHPKVQVMPDLSFLYPFTRNGGSAPIQQHPPVCGVQLREVPGLEVDQWVSALQQLPASLRGIPFSTYDVWEETRILRQLDNACAHGFAPKLYENLDLMVGTAFHSVLFAIQAGVPVVAIAYAPKVERFMEDVGLGDCLLQPDEWEKLPAAVDRILRERDRLIDQLRETATELTELSRKVVQKVKSEIESSGRRHAQPRPTVSIVVATCSSEADNQRTLESCLSQTHENTEVILVDANPASEAGNATPETLVRVILSNGSESLGERLNRGFARASGQYLTWIAGGNLYSADAIACMLDRLCQEPTTDMVYANYYTFHNPALIAGVQQVYSPRKLIRRNVVGPCFLYRRSLAEALGPYRTDSLLADYDYWLRAGAECSLRPMRTPLLHALESCINAADHRGERTVRRQWRATKSLPLRIFWQLVDTDLVEGLVIRPLLTTLRRFQAALRSPRRAGPSR